MDADASHDESGLLRRLARRYWQLGLVLGFTATLLLCGFSYGYGFKRGHGFHDAWLAELQGLRRQQLDSEQHLVNLNQQLVNLRQGARIDREAAEQVREDVLASELSIAALQADLVFYRSLMTPTATEQGLGVRSFQVYATSDPQTFRYELIMQQLALRHALLKGQVRLILRGQMEGVELELSLKDLSGSEGIEARAFQFRYFQKLEGTLVLPVGFQPGLIELTAQINGKRRPRVAKQFEWTITGV